jgi:hypothetical protein
MLRQRLLIMLPTGLSQVLWLDGVWGLDWVDSLAERLLVHELYTLRTKRRLVNLRYASVEISTDV